MAYHFKKTHGKKLLVAQQWKIVLDCIVVNSLHTLQRENINWLSLKQFDWIRRKFQSKNQRGDKSSASVFGIFAEHDRASVDQKSLWVRLKLWSSSLEFLHLCGRRTLRINFLLLFLSSVFGGVPLLSLAAGREQIKKAAQHVDGAGGEENCPPGGLSRLKNICAYNEFANSIIIIVAWKICWEVSYTDCAAHRGFYLGMCSVLALELLIKSNTYYNV